MACVGDWTVEGIGADLEKRLESLGGAAEIILDCQAISAMDTAGAWLLHRARRAWESAGQPARMEYLQPEHAALLGLVERHAAPLPPPAPRPRWIERLGRSAWQWGEDGFDFLAFLGETVIALLCGLRQPGRIRWQQVGINLQRAGLDAMPIVGLMAFLIGVVMAYQGGAQLRLYGANIFIADLVGLTLLRELGPMLTAIMVAGRTGSAYTAQIAAMKINEEIDAMRTMGISPMELLVIPKLLALIVALPLLVVFANLMGLLGGMVVAQLTLDVSYSDFLLRLQKPIMLRNYWIGLGKAPVFAILIVLIGCYQGFRAGDSADSVGSQVTRSVVQAIFVVIIADALFSIGFSWMRV
jgi:phospholipid/cholesterol/gamma-HCH transport system permease protein